MVLLLANERPVNFCSRTMTEAVKIYPPIENEILVMLFASEEFHQYAFVRRIIFQTDHKLSISIVNERLNMDVGRLK